VQCDRTNFFCNKYCAIKLKHAEFYVDLKLVENVFKKCTYRIIGKKPEIDVTTKTVKTSSTMKTSA
jgi:hypothetical protein